MVTTPLARLLRATDAKEKHDDSEAKAPLLSQAVEVDWLPPASLLLRQQRNLDDMHVYTDRQAPRNNLCGCLLRCLTFPYRLLLLIIGAVQLIIGYALAKLEELLLRHPVKDTYVGILAWRLMVFFSRTKVSVEYPEGESWENLRDTPYLVANHVTYMDGPFMNVLLWRPRLLATSWSLRTPILGRMAKEMRFMAVDLADEASRKETQERINQHAVDWKQSVVELGKSAATSQSLLFFPEGSLCNGERLGFFKRGAFVPGKPVRPIVALWRGPNGYNPSFTLCRRCDVHGCDASRWKKKYGEERVQGFLDSQFPESTEKELCDPKRILETIDEGSYDPSAQPRQTPSQLLEAQTWKPWMLDYLCQPYIQLTLKVLPAYTPSEAEVQDPDLFAANVQRLMQKEYQRLRLASKLK